MRVMKPATGMFKRQKQTAREGSLCFDVVNNFRLTSNDGGWRGSSVSRRNMDETQEATLKLDAIYTCRRLCRSSALDSK